MGIFDLDGGQASGPVLPGNGTYGKNSVIGGAGEDLYAAALKREGFTPPYEVVRSLAIPSLMSDRKKMAGDVDVAVASGNNLVLIDVKRWAAGHAYWSIPIIDKPMKGLTPHRKDDGEWRLSQNMAIALERYSDRLPRTNIIAMTVFVPTNSKGSLPSTVARLNWPGGIRSYLMPNSFPILRAYLGPAREANPLIRNLLTEMKASFLAS